jgi:UDP-N-acetylmuramoyl-tripeptide--D-alanyl-D-alanine ligase
MTASPHLAPLWTIADLQQILQAEILPTVLAQELVSSAVTGVSIDTRSLQAGDLYISLVGEVHDGHKFAAKAIELGAAACLNHHAVDGGLPAGAIELRVANTEAALVQLAQAARDRAQAKLVAITGSSGKSTTKEIMTSVIAGQSRVEATAGNLNNHIGLPLSLARLHPDTPYGVFELGMNHAGEIANLTRVLKPHVAIITTIGTAHIEFFTDGQQGIARAKAEIFEGVQPGGCAIIPHEAHAIDILRSAAAQYGVTQVRSFGKDHAADAVLLSCTPLPQGGSQVRARLSGREIDFSWGLMGEHNATNALAVLLAVEALGLDMGKALHSLGQIEPLKGRGSRAVYGDVLVIDDCYNANPQSMVAALANLGACQPSTAQGRKIAVLGPMFELGEQGPALHAGLLPALEAAGVDQLFCCGELMQHLWAIVPQKMQGAWAESAAALAPLVAGAVQAGDCVLVKGSRGQQVMIEGKMCPSMAQVIAAIADKMAAAKGGINAA